MRTQHVEERNKSIIVPNKLLFSRKKLRNASLPNKLKRLNVSKNKQKLRIMRCGLKIESFAVCNLINQKPLEVQVQS